MFLLHFIDAAGNDAWLEVNGGFLIVGSGSPVTYSISQCGSNYWSGLSLTTVRSIVSNYVVLEG